MAYPTRIYLTGFMGSGKSTAGPLLAGSIGYDFADLDAVIEAKSRRPIRRIFAAEGEEAFRRLESEALREVSARDGVVVALGGGAIASEENRAVIRDGGLLVYLRLDADELAERLRRIGTDRPLLLDSQGQPLAEEALVVRIRDMLKERSAYYESADIIVDAAELDPAQTAEAVRHELRQAE